MIIMILWKKSNYSLWTIFIQSDFFTLGMNDLKFDTFPYNFDFFAQLPN